MGILAAETHLRGYVEMLQMILMLLCDTFGLEVLASNPYHLGMHLCLDDFTVICLELTSKLV